MNPLVSRTKVDIRPQNLNPTAINALDCEVDATLTFSLALSAFCSDVHLEAWVGETDCAPLAARTTATATCSPLLSAAIPPAANVTVSIRAQDIVTGEVTSGSKPTTYAAATEAACHVQSAPGPVPLSIYFLWLDGTGNPVGTGGVYPIEAALRGPAAPSNVVAEPRDGALNVTWAPGADSAVTSFVVYAEPANGGKCPGSVLGSADAKQAAIGGSTATMALVPGLANGKDYTVAVTAIDAFGNSSALSTPECATPTTPSGGTCALTVPAGHSGSSAFALGGLGALMLLARRRAKK